MNSREAYEILRKSLPDLAPSVKNHGLNADPSYTFTNLNKYRKAFNSVHNSGLLGFPIIEDTVNRLGVFLKENEDEISLSFSNGYNIDSALKSIYSILTGLFSFLKNQLHDESPNTLNVKIQKIEDLDELEKIANMLKKSFNIPVVQMGGHVIVDGLENGSAWIILGVKDATGNALKLCASLIWSAAVILNKREKVNQNEEYNKEIGLPDVVIKQISEYNISYINDSIDTETNSIANEFITDDSETLGRLKLAIESIGNLIEKGVEFYPSVESSEEIRKLFPDFSTIKLLESKTLLIDSGQKKSQ